MKNYPICYKLSVTNPSPNSDNQNKTEIVKKSIYIESETVSPVLEFMNLHVTTFFNFESFGKISDTLKMIYKCTAKSVSILNGIHELTFDELKFLIGHGNIVYLDLCEIKCTYENGMDVPMEEILRSTPKIQFFNIVNPVFTPETAQTIANLPFQNKIHKFWFISQQNELDPKSFSEFIVKNASDNCEINYIRGAEKTEFDKILQKAIYRHWKGKHKPYLYK